MIFEEKKLGLEFFFKTNKRESNFQRFTHRGEIGIHIIRESGD
jgi:hypothetical protein